MSFLELLLSVIFSILYDSLVTLLLVLFFLSLFRIRDSNTRILFFFLPLVKPLFVITEMVNINRAFVDDRFLYLGIRLPDPNNILRISDTFLGDFPIAISDTNLTMLIVVTSMFIAAILIRWIHLGFFYRALSFEERVGKEELPVLYKIMENYSFRIGIEPPSISLTHKRYFSPFLIGIRNKTLVISPNLLDSLTFSEKETLISHELSHVKRRDNLISWAALIFRDLCIFNPFAHIAYYLIRSEQERGADRLMAANSDKDNREIAKNILNSILKYKEVLSGKRVPEESSAFWPFKYIGNKRLYNRINSILEFEQKKLKLKIFPRILTYILFAILFIFQVVLFVRIGDIILFLR